jgi:hypothetical protein
MAETETASNRQAEPSDHSRAPLPKKLRSAPEAREDSWQRFWESRTGRTASAKVKVEPERGASFHCGTDEAPLGESGVAPAPYAAGRAGGCPHKTRKKIHRLGRRGYGLTRRNVPNTRRNVPKSVNIFECLGTESAGRPATLHRAASAGGRGRETPNPSPAEAGAATLDSLAVTHGCSLVGVASWVQRGPGEPEPNAWTLPFASRG